jgi:hypothetical protein
LSHSLWARQQQQRAQIDDEIARVMRPPHTASAPDSLSRQELHDSLSRQDVHTEHALAAGALKPLAAGVDGGGGGGKVKVTVTVTRPRDGDSALR